MYGILLWYPKLTNANVNLLEIEDQEEVEQYCTMKKTSFLFLSASSQVKADELS